MKHLINYFVRFSFLLPCTLTTICFVATVSSAQVPDRSQLPLPTVINGIELDPKGTPLVALLIRDNDGGQGICSGTIIGDSTVITAAHCLVSVEKMYVIVGGDTPYRVSRIKIHPNARLNSARYAQYDVGIINIKGKFPKSIRRIKVSTKSPQPGEVVAVFGYGLDENGIVGNLRAGPMRIERLSKYLIHLRFEPEIGGSNICNGDSGGPLIIRRNGGPPEIAGVVSTGDLECVETAEFSRLTLKKTKDFVKKYLR